MMGLFGKLGRMPAAAAALGLAMAVAAIPAAGASAKDKKDDPDRQICKSKPVVGSRLKRIRECATAAQWEEMKLQERVGLMRRQVNGDAGCPQPPCGMQNGGRDTPF